MLQWLTYRYLSPQPCELFTASPHQHGNAPYFEAICAARDKVLRDKLETPFPLASVRSQPNPTLYLRSNC